MMVVFFFFFSSRRRHTRCREVSWARRCVQETGYQRRVHGNNKRFSFNKRRQGRSAVRTTISYIHPFLQASNMKIMQTGSLEKSSLILLVTIGRISYTAQADRAFKSDQGFFCNRSRIMIY
eukprot:TRINITY_DN25422_c0_g1_i2.p6 TRINITY_DN25422_c0_g1~~TRINITY_DN25422_c0_g1_i2.p6  ORF type:complete len:121 (-),score=30.53 TRINITY_DN25422_c0_g1_i2:973-1335(-)